MPASADQADLTLEQGGGSPRPTPAAGFLNEALHLECAVVVNRGESSDSPEVSVVVPTRNRNNLLRETLQALFMQDLPGQAYEVIVVDNASDDETVDMLRLAAAASPCVFRVMRFTGDCGPAVARNLGVALARGGLVAFTDSDCLPTSGWLRTCMDKMSPGIGIVQGRTLPDPRVRPRLFSHYIVTTHMDGSFSTSNVCYRREAIIQVGGFDPGCDYWEDTDLGWRVTRAGWAAVFSGEALVHHQVLPLSPFQWLKWPLHSRTMPAKAARYPEFRSHLFLGLWVDWHHTLFDLAVVALILGALVHKAWFLLILPYVVAFPIRRGLGGRWPPLKALLHVAWDTVSFGVLAVSSLRYRALVL